MNGFTNNRIFRWGIYCIFALQGINAVNAEDVTFVIVNQTDVPGFPSVQAQIMIGSTSVYTLPSVGQNTTESFVRDGGAIDGQQISARWKQFPSTFAYETHTANNSAGAVYTFTFGGDPPLPEYMMNPEICNNTPYAKTYSVTRAGETLAIVNVPGGGCKTLTLGPFTDDTPKVTVSWSDDAGNSFTADYYDYYQSGGQPLAQSSTDTVGSFDHRNGDPLESYPGLINWDEFEDAVLDAAADPASDETLRKGFDQNYALALEANQAMINQLNDLKNSLSGLSGGNATGFSNVNGNLMDLETAIAQLEGQLATNQATLAGMRTDQNNLQGTVAANTAAGAASAAASAADLAQIKSTLGTIAGQTAGLATETTLNELKSQNLSQFTAVLDDLGLFKTGNLQRLSEIDAKLNIIRIGTEQVSARILSLNEQQTTRNNELKNKFDANTSAVNQITSEVNTQGTRIVNALDPIAANTQNMTDSIDVVKDNMISAVGKLEVANNLAVNAYDQFQDFKDNQEQFQFENTNRLDIIATVAKSLTTPPNIEAPEYYGNQGKTAAETQFATMDQKGDAFLQGPPTATGGSLDFLTITIPAGASTYTIDLNPATNMAVAGFLTFSKNIWTWVLRLFYVGLLWFTIEKLLQAAPQAQQQGLAFPGLINNPIVKIPFAIIVTVMIGTIPVIFFTWLESVGYTTSILGNPLEGTGFGASIELARQGYPLDETIFLAVFYLGFRMKAMFLYQAVCAFIRAIGK